MQRGLELEREDRIWVFPREEGGGGGGRQPPTLYEEGDRVRTQGHGESYTAGTHALMTVYVSNSGTRAVGSQRDSERKGQM